MRNFRRLNVWLDARKLVKEVYELSRQLPDDEKFGLTTQIRRSVISVPANISEGCAKYSQKDFIRYLQISLGSLYELESHFILTADLKFLPDSQVDSIIDQIQTLQKRISALLNYNRSKLK